jgi:hypothetical protein
MLNLLFLACSLPTTQAPPPPPATFVARASITGGTLYIFNDSDTAWANVVAAPGDALACTIGVVPAKGAGQVLLKDCAGTAPAAPVTEVRVSAAQGEAIATIPPTDLAGILASAPAEPVPTPRPKSGGTSSPSATTTAAPPPSEAAPTTEAMRGSASMSGGFGPARRITYNNENSYGWSGCTLVLNDTYTYNLGTLPARGGEGVMLVRFKDKGGNILTSNAQINKATARCDQGSTSTTPR